MKVVLLCDQGESIAVIAKFLFIDEQTVRRHLHDYIDSEKLSISSGGSVSKLDPAQTAKLIATLKDSDVTNVQAVVQNVKGLFGVEFSISGMTDWLKRNDFSFKKVSRPQPKPIQ